MESTERNGKLREISFYRKNEVGNIFDAISQVYVSELGQFSIRLPDALLGSLSAVEKSKYGVRIMNKDVVGPDLTQCQYFIEKVIDEFLRVKIKHELIIVYAHNPTMKYYLGNDDQVYADGEDYVLVNPKKNSYPGSKWNETSLKMNDRTTSYSLNFSACVMHKTTFTQGDKDTFEYRPANEQDFSEADIYGRKLQMFKGLSMLLPNDISKMQGNDTVVVPFTESRAEFFYNKIIEFCTLNQSITDHINSRVFKDCSPAEYQPVKLLAQA